MDAARVFECLLSQKKTLTTAESCTGGLIAKLLTDLPGTSEVFDSGFITYSNEAKTAMLGVPAELIKQHGAVSEEVAKAMAEGARKTAGTDVAVAVTGIAGPAGGSAEKPVGLVYIAVATAQGTTTQKHLFTGSRDEIRHATANRAFELIYSCIS